MGPLDSACNIFGGPDDIAHKLAVLRRHCDDLGRDPNEIEVTAMYRDIAPGLHSDGGPRGRTVRLGEEAAEVAHKH